MINIFMVQPMASLITFYSSVQQRSEDCWGFSGNPGTSDFSKQAGMFVL